MKNIKALVYTILVIVMPIFCEAQMQNLSVVGDGVVINGVKWASSNIDKPGTFATSPEKPGMFYQWNNNLGWSATNPIINTRGGRKWDYNHNSSNSDGTAITKWATANDPSPKGWRIPTVEEFRTLLDKEKVVNEWTTQNGVRGRIFTDKKTGQTIFLPAAGNRHDESIENEEDMKKLYYVGEQGQYWSTSLNEHGWFLLFLFSNRRAVISENLECTNETAMSIRCVAMSQSQLTTLNTTSSTSGKFPKASKQLLTNFDLQNVSKQELKIMRNEIFARHGYIFKSDDMKAYFKNQNWYKPQYDNVNSMLTNIELKNIELIKRYE